MADKEKIVPEAEETAAPAEEAKAEETAAPVEEAKAEETAAPVEEAKAEAAPEAKEEKKEVKKEKKEKAEKKPLNVKLLGIVAGAVVGVVVIALLVTALVSGSSAISAFKNKDYEKAYKAAGMAWFMNSADKDTVKEAYILNVLCKNGAFYEAYELLESTNLSEEKKNEIYSKNGNLAMCKPGQIATFGQYDTVPVEWLVLDVKTVKVDGKKRAQALLMTKDIIGTPNGWGATTVYGESDLHDFCNITFKAQFSMGLTPAEQKSVCTTKISTPDGDVTAWAFAPSKAELDAYFVDDMAQYIQAAPTQGAKMAGVSGTATSKYASYYLRDIGKLEGSTQFASGVNHEGKIGDGFSMEQRSIGARVCINVDLGEI